MNKEILYEILNSESESLSTTEIESILNEELDKSPEEMDTDLVDLCLDALETVGEKKLNKRKHRIRISRVLIAAVIFVLMIGLSIPACARFFSIDVPDGIVKFYNDSFNVDISNDKYVDDIIGQLEQDGINDVTLPKIVFSEGTTVADYCFENEETSYIEFSFSNDEIKGYVTIQKFNSNFDFALEKTKTTAEFEKVEYIEINEIHILVFGNDDVSYMQYVNNNMEYNIQINCNYETALQIAKTL